MALFSVWDWDHNAWAIYRNSQPVSVGDDPKPPKPTGISQLGADPDTEVKPLPSDARFVGFDHLCRGEVRRRNSGALAGLGISLPTSENLVPIAIGVAIGIAIAVGWRRRR